MMDTPRLRFRTDDGSEFPDWNYKSLSNIFDTRNGYTPSKSNAQYWENGDIPWFRMEDIRANGGVLTDSIQHVTKESLKKSGTFPPNTVIFATSATIGEHALLVNPSLCNQRFTAIIPKAEYNNLSPLFIYYQGFLIDKHILKTQMISTMPVVNLSSFLNYQFAIPTIPEQQKIADFLSSYDEKISIQRERVEALERRKKGLLQKVFSQEIRFKADDGSEFPEWEKKSIDSLFHVSAGGDIDKDHFSVLKGGDYIYPIYANALTNDGLYGYSSKYTVEDKAITVTGRGEIGHATAREGKFTPIVRLLVCKPKNFENTKYFEEAINNSKIIIESTGVPQLTVPQLKKIILPVPSQHEQQMIANFFTAIDDQINIEKERLAIMERIKKGLLQGLFC